MKPIRWTTHAEKKAVQRDVARGEVELTVWQPDAVTPGTPPRRVHTRRFLDVVLQAPMLLRVVVEETATELVVVTLYKTSKFGKYLPGSQP